MFFDRFDRPEIAASVYGTSTNYGSIQFVINLPATVDHLHSVLSESVFDECVDTGAAMELVDAVDYARR